jgi:hypothetical protein
MYSECEAGDMAAARDVMAQVKAFFPAFDDCLGRQRAARSHCSCDACSGIDKLRLKAFVHAGEMALKRVRQFEEMAGESVIFVHRLLKNSVAQREYVLMSEAARAAAGIDETLLSPHEEDLEGVGPARLWLCSAEKIPFDLPAGGVPAPAHPPAAPAAQGFGKRLWGWFGGR